MWKKNWKTKRKNWCVRVRRTRSSSQEYSQVEEILEKIMFCSYKCFNVQFDILIM